MKTLLFKTFILLTLLVAVSSCDKEEVMPQSKLIGTKWTADDDIGALFWGKGATTTIEFLNSTECQRLNKYKVVNTFSVDVKKGTYTFDGETVVWKIGDIVVEGKLSGSVIMTKEGFGNNRVYTKE